MRNFFFNSFAEELSDFLMNPKSTKLSLVLTLINSLIATNLSILAIVDLNMENVDTQTQFGSRKTQI